MGAELPHAVQRPAVQPAGAVGLRLQPDPDVLDGAGEDGVGEAGEGAAGVELPVGERGRAVVERVAGFELPAGVVEAAELDGDLGEFNC